MSDDAAALIAHVHGQALRLISNFEGKHFIGLTVAGRHYRRLGVLTNNTCKKLEKLDATFAFTRHVTKAQCSQFIDELGHMLSQDIPPAKQPTMNPMAPEFVPKEKIEGAEQQAQTTAIKDKSMGESHQITIPNEKGREPQAEIHTLEQETEQFRAEIEAYKHKIEATIGLDVDHELAEAIDSGEKDLRDLYDKYLEIFANDGVTSFSQLSLNSAATVKSAMSASITKAIPDKIMSPSAVAVVDSLVERVWAYYLWKDQQQDKAHEPEEHKKGEDTAAAAKEQEKQKKKNKKKKADGARMLALRS